MADTRPSSPLGRRAALGALGAATAAPALHAQPRGGFPNRQIRLIIPWPPGGSADSQLRSMAELATSVLGQSVVVENRSGARGTLGAVALMQARPDGYTVAQQHLSVLRHPFMTSQRTWDPVGDFTYIIGAAGWLFGVVVRADSPWQTWRDYVAEAKASPGRLTFSTSGIATSNHIAMEDLLAREGAEMTHVPFRGTTEGITALLGGQIDSVADSSAWAPFVEEGRCRLLCVWSAERVARFPDAPTLKELGYDMVVTSPYGIAGPKGMSPEVVSALHGAFKRALFDPANKAIRDRWDMPLEYMSTEDYLEFVRRRVAYEREMVARLELKLD
jgi:tripartite-type tricarboxylate transporter receptor subunit TctC